MKNKPPIRFVNGAARLGKMWQFIWDESSPIAFTHIQAYTEICHLFFLLITSITYRFSTVAEPLEPTYLPRKHFIWCLPLDSFFGASI